MHTHTCTNSIRCNTTILSLVCLVTATAGVVDVMQCVYRTRIDFTVQILLAGAHAQVSARDVLRLPPAHIPRHMHLLQGQLAALLVDDRVLCVCVCVYVCCVYAHSCDSDTINTLHQAMICMPTEIHF